MVADADPASDALGRPRAARWAVASVAFGSGLAGDLPHFGGFAAHLVPDSDVAALPYVEPADHDRDERDDDRVDQARVEIARRRQQPGGDQRQEATEPAVPQVVRDGQARIADARGEVF